VETRVMGGRIVVACSARRGMVDRAASGDVVFGVRRPGGGVASERVVIGTRRLRGGMASGSVVFMEDG
jgi:hypothetical protein